MQLLHCFIYPCIGVNINIMNATIDQDKQKEAYERGKSLDVASYRSGPKVTKQKKSEDINVSNVDDEPIHTLF